MKYNPVRYNVFPIYMIDPRHRPVQYHPLAHRYLWCSSPCCRHPSESPNRGLYRLCGAKDSFKFPYIFIFIIYVLKVSARGWGHAVAQPLMNMRFFPIVLLMKKQFGSCCLPLFFLSQPEFIRYYKQKKLSRHFLEPSVSTPWKSLISCGRALKTFGPLNPKLSQYCVRLLDGENGTFGTAQWRPFWRILKISIPKSGARPFIIFRMYSTAYHSRFLSREKRPISFNLPQWHMSFTECIFFV